jgi:hypothetical protein
VAKREGVSNSSTIIYNTAVTKQLVNAKKRARILVATVPWLTSEVTVRECGLRQTGAPEGKRRDIQLVSNPLIVNSNGELSLELFRCRRVLQLHIIR